MFAMYNSYTQHASATGGTKVGPVNIGGVNYYIHIFTNSGSLVVSRGSLTVDVLVVGGGGGAAGYQSGGAGAGGLIFRPNYLVSGNIPVTVGLGGIGTTAFPAGIGNPGQNSIFSGLTALGGGAGTGTNTSSPGQSGGSGGGACTGSGQTNNSIGGIGLQPSQSGESGTYGYGNNGGGNSSGTSPGGGGGAGAAGGTGGGNGLYQVTADNIVYNFATVFNTTEYGQNSGGNIYFAGGGSGGYGGTGGLGGGGTGGGDFASGTSGAANTGGGAGGSGNGFGGTNASGGSGIVMLRYKAYSL